MANRARLSRDRFTDEEWKLHQAGKCCKVIEHGTPHVKWCGKPIDPNSKHGTYCTGCDQSMREDYPHHY